MSLSLITAFIVSVVMHAGLIFFGPEIRYSDPPDVDKDPVEVEMVAREVPIPDALRPKPLPPVPKPEPLDLERLLARSDRSQGPSKPSFEAAPTIDRFAKTPKSRPLSGPPKLSLPRQVTGLDQIAQDRLRSLPKTSGREDFPLSVPAPSAGLHERKEFAVKERARQFLSEELTRLKELEATQPGRQSIRGPAATRRIVFRPPPPKPDFSGISGDITLRFWVLSDGTVGRVIPVRKGNARLEGIAVNHMKRWRFSPLPPGTPEREEWGLIVFRFRLR